MAKDATEIYIETRETLLKAQQQSFQQFDKAILTLSGGGLALTLAFLKDIVPLEAITYRPLLITSWSFFVVSLCSTLLSFLSSQWAYEKQIELLDEIYRGGSSEAKENRLAAQTTKVLNISSGTCFILAVALLVFFVSVNLTREVAEMSGETHAKVQQGQVPSPLHKVVIDVGRQDMIRGAVPPPLPPAQLFQGAQSATGQGQGQGGQTANTSGGDGAKR